MHITHARFGALANTVASIRFFFSSLLLFSPALSHRHAEFRSAPTLVRRSPRSDAPCAAFRDPAPLCSTPYRLGSGMRASLHSHPAFP